MITFQMIHKRPKQNRKRNLFIEQVINQCKEGKKMKVSKGLNSTRRGFSHLENEWHQTAR